MSGTMTWTRMLLACACLVQASASFAADLTLDGDVHAPQNWSINDVKAMAHNNITVKDSGGADHIYSGVLLSSLLSAGGVPLKAALTGHDIAKYLHVEGQDGFAAVVALPEFDNYDFLVADGVDGAPLPSTVGPLQLISPSEARHSRWIKHLILLRIKTSVK